MKITFSLASLAWLAGCGPSAEWDCRTESETYPGVYGEQSVECAPTGSAAQDNAYIRCKNAETIDDGTCDRLQCVEKDSGENECSPADYDPNE